MNRRRTDILDVGEPTLRRRRTDERSQNETSVSGGPATNKVTSTTFPMSDGDAKETEKSQNETINSHSVSSGAKNKVTSTTVPRSDGRAKETAAERICFDWNLVCSCGGGSAQLKNDCDTLSTDTFPDRYPPTGGNKFHSPFCVELSSSSVLCKGETRARRWLKYKAKQCGIGITKFTTKSTTVFEFSLGQVRNKEKEGDSGEAQEWAKGKEDKEGDSDKAPYGTKGM
ncbi:uncharacterized protein [Montipora foliosa]|uniref:uncharacterized protein n=1 Tax=Montipora foliosa TaxID=591990 RepID=UPI0035F1B851